MEPPTALLGRTTAATLQPGTSFSFRNPLLISQTKPVRVVRLNTRLSSNTRNRKQVMMNGVSLSQPSVTETCRPVAGGCIGESETAVRLQRLVMEFQLLTEPIDRVKRLLQYATILPMFDDSARLESNRVTGCTSQVWLEARMDGHGKMRFRADSDSEITKGFCSCLIWVLDGAEPGEVLAIRAEDFAPMNMGLVAHSRVNTWHNVLIGMQKRTNAMMKRLDLDPFLSTSSAGVDENDGRSQAHVEADSLTSHR